MFSCLVQKAVDYSMTVLCFRKNTLIFLDDERYSVMFKPLVGIFRPELFEESLEQFGSAWVCLPQVTYVGEGVGAVASAASRDFNLLQWAVLLLKDGDVDVWHHLFDVDGQEESCGSASYDGKRTCLPLLFCTWRGRHVGYSVDGGHCFLYYMFDLRKAGHGLGLLSSFESFVDVGTDIFLAHEFVESVLCKDGVNVIIDA